MLVMCTDGILERRTVRGQFFDEDRLLRAIDANKGASAGEILEGLFAAAYDYGAGRPWENDATAVVIVRQ